MIALESDILNVLLGLMDGKTRCISDIFYGLDNYPVEGSEQDERIRAIEKDLIERRLVLIIEESRTNKTKNGYYLFKISSKGRAFVGNSRTKTNRNKLPVYALSTAASNTELQDVGLNNRGLLGYLDGVKSDETFGLQYSYLTFPQREDHFYTLDPLSERLEGRAPQSRGVLGFARKTPASGYHLLHRFFDDDYQNHIYLTYPNLEGIKQKRFRTEFIDNPIYIRTARTTGSIPVYLFSKEEISFFRPLEEGADYQSSSAPEKEFPGELTNQLKDIIASHEIDETRYLFYHESPGSTTISIRETFYNFYINVQLNGTHYTVRRNPMDTEAYLINDVDNWSEVLARCARWIKDVIELMPEIINRDQVTESAQNSGATAVKEEASVKTEKVDTTAFGNAAFSIGDRPVEAAFGVDALAEEIARIIKNLKPEPGNMTGIFGSWGRGKTRLMNEIWSRLEKDNSEVEFKRINYQAWRYQDTPASWAYLYEQFSDSFLGPKKGFCNFFIHNYRLLVLNIERNGIGSLIFAWLWLCGALYFGAFLILLTPFKENFESWFSIYFGPPILGFFLGIIIKNFRMEYFTRAVNLIKKYGVHTSFREKMGIQAEIQKELIHLIHAWVNRDSKKKLALFVDDLDRCTEEKTIEIIDALRIILDDETIKNKLFVIAAIDERILHLAVRKKYQNAVEEFPGVDLVREYIDKLFIFSVKLGSLSETESMEFFDKLLKDELELEESEPKDFEATIKVSASVERITGNTAPVPGQSTIFQSVGKEQPSRQAKKLIIKITRREVDMFKNCIHQVKDATPRKIRILYYRYMFARNMLITTNGAAAENDYWLTSERHSTFINLLIIHSQKPNTELTKLIEDASGSREEFIFIDVDLVQVKRKEYVRLLKIFELTIAY